MLRRDIATYSAEFSSGADTEDPYRQAQRAVAKARVLSEFLASKDDFASQAFRDLYEGVRGYFESHEEVKPTASSAPTSPLGER